MRSRAMGTRWTRWASPAAKRGAPVLRATVGVGGAVGAVAHAVPRVAHGALGLFPAEAALALGAVPLVAERGLGVGELLAAVAGAAFPAVLIGGGVIVV